MRSELDSLIAAAALASVIAGVALEFGLAAALIIGGCLVFAAVALVKRGSPS